MLRLTGVFLLFFSCVGTGVFMERQEKQRIRELQEMIRSMEYLKGEINFARTTLPEAMEQLSRHILPPFQNLFVTLAQELRQHPGSGFSDILRDVLAIEKNNWHLTEEDVESFYQACCNLGYLDKEMQIHILERYMKELEKTAEALARELPEKMKLYRSLGVLGGVFLVIILI